MHGLVILNRTTSIITDMKKILYPALVILASAGYSACKKAQDFNRDYAIPTGVGAYPVSSNTLVDVATNRNLGTVNLPAGYTATTELQFFAQDPLKEVNLYSTVATGARTKVGTWPYKAAYSQLKRLDTLLVPYTMPAAASNTSIKLDYEFLNQNGLTLLRTVTVKVL